MYWKFIIVLETEMSQTASTHQGICFLVLWVEGGPGYSENTSLKKRWGGQVKFQVEEFGWKIS